MASEPRRDELTRYKRLMENRGLVVSERSSRQATLTGGSVEYRAVTGYQQGSYKIMVRLEPTPLVQLVGDASSSEDARRLADKLRELGFSVEVEEQRVRASTKKPSLALVSRAIDAAEEHTR